MTAYSATPRTAASEPGPSPAPTTLPPPPEPAVTAESGSEASTTQIAERWIGEHVTVALAASVAIGAAAGFALKRLR